MNIRRVRPPTGPGLRKVRRMGSARACLWFPRDKAPEAVACYTELVPRSRVVWTRTFEGADPAQGADLWEIDLAGTAYHVMGADHAEEFNTSVSIMLEVQDQRELDAVWDGFLARGGQELQCSWIVDPYGVRWQILPRLFFEVVGGPDRAKAQRVVEAIWQMGRVDVAALERAAAGR